MLFSDKSEVRHLNYHPRRHGFSMARVEWHNLILNGYARPTQPIIDLSHEDLTQLVNDLLRPESFIELFELHKAFSSEPKICGHFNWSEIFQLNNKNWCQRTEQLFSKMVSLPEDFISWAFQRKMEKRDLMPLNALSNIAEFTALFSQFNTQGLTRSQGKLIIDLLVDLILLGKTHEELSPLPNLNWVQSLQELRNPNTLKNQESKNTQNSWPQYVQEQKFRQGDRWQKRLNIDFTDHKDLKKKLFNLSERTSLE